MMLEDRAKSGADLRLGTIDSMHLRAPRNVGVQGGIGRRPATRRTPFPGHDDRAVPELGQVAHELCVPLHASAADGRKVIGDHEDSGHLGAFARTGYQSRQFRSTPHMNLILVEPSLPFDLASRARNRLNGYWPSIGTRRIVLSMRSLSRRGRPAGN